MKLIARADDNRTCAMQEFRTVERTTFEAEGKTWRIDVVQVNPNGIWLAAERQTKAGKDYARGHGRAFMFHQLPVDIAAAIVDALAPESKAVPAVAPVERKRLGMTRLEDFRDGISYEQRRLSWMTQSDLGYDLAEREGIDDQMGRRLIEATCSGLPLTITWQKPIRDGRFERTTATALVQMVVPGRIRVSYWGFEHFVYIADLVEVSVPRTKWEVIDPQADAAPTEQEPHRESSDAAPYGVRYSRAERTEQAWFATDAEREQWIASKGEWIDVIERLNPEPSLPEPSTAGLTAETLELFLDYARDAANWGGRPLVGGNVGGGAAGNGHLTQMKKQGLIVTQDEGRDVWIVFRPAGRALAKAHGVEID